MDISKDLIKKIRNQTGAGIVEIKKALIESQGEEVKAIEVLRKKGEKIALKKQDRKTHEGVIASYVHANNKVASLVEMTCETDFVAKNNEFIELTHDIAMQVVALNPTYLSPEDVPAKIIAKEKEIAKAQLSKEGKPENIIDKIVKGKMEKYFEEVCLLKQSYIKDDKKTIEELIKEKIAKLGENITVKKFIRFSL